MGLSNECRQGEGEENGEDERTSERRQMQTRKETETEKSEWARAKRVMKTKLELDEVELQAEPQAKCPHSVWPRTGADMGTLRYLAK